MRAGAEAGPVGECGTRRRRREGGRACRMSGPQEGFGRHLSALGPVSALSRGETWFLENMADVVDVKKEPGHGVSTSSLSDTLNSVPRDGPVEMSTAA